MLILVHFTPFVKQSTLHGKHSVKRNKIGLDSFLGGVYHGGYSWVAKPYAASTFYIRKANKMDEMLALAQIGEANQIVGFIVFTATNTVSLDGEVGIVEAEMDVVTPVEIHAFLNTALAAIKTRLEDENLSDSRMELPVDSHLLGDEGNGE
jgi:hypothetical protein